MIFLSAKAFKGIPTKTLAVWNRTLCFVNLAGQLKKDIDWKSQNNGETSGVNKSEARFLSNCSVDNWEGITTIQLHSGGASYAGGVISPTLKRLQGDPGEVILQNSSETGDTASHIHNLCSISNICMTKIFLIEPNSQIMSQC